MKYTALTIGPIVKSLMLAHRTKELWAASYFFSFLMKEITEFLKKDENIVVPYPYVKQLSEGLELKIKSVGIYPDRLILESENGLFNDLQKAVEMAMAQTAHKFITDTDKLKNYLNTHIVEFEYEKRPEKENDNFVFQANDFLATCELQSNYQPKDNEVFLKILQNIDKTEIYKTTFVNKKYFPSIIEIATRGLETTGINFNNENIKDEEIWKEITEKNGDNFKQSHKYIAIVQADGDNVGKIISQVAQGGDSQNIKDFSKALSTFTLKAAKQIAEYGGENIYAGGDDLLFFAPVATKSENIFSLIKNIDETFKTEIADKYSEAKASMSYGVSISYYKFPMHEALATAQNLLFDKAKKFDNKNAVAFQIQKHSGQSFDAILSKPLSDDFSNMLKADTDLEINSVIYNLEKHKTILQEIADSKQKLTNFFDNFYNEKIHKKNEVKDFLDTVKKILVNTHTQTKDIEKTLEIVYAQLRTVKFLTSKHNDSN